VGGGFEIKVFIVQAWFTMTQAQPMNTHEQFCPNLGCKARGQRGAGNITLHSQKRRRYKCTACGKTFSERRGTMFAGLRTDPSLVVIVVTLLAYGCPIQAIVQAYALDERTVAAWRDRAGEQCQAVHQAVVQQGNLDLAHVQADEIRVKGRGWIAWLGLALMVSTRLWLGGVVRATRDRTLADRLLNQVRACARRGCAVLVCVDGWTAYPKAILRAFREKIARPGQPGRPRWQVWEALGIARVIKHTTQAGKSVLDITTQIVRGAPAFIAQQLFVSQGGVEINTAYIERLNATCRERLAVLTRRCRHAAKRLEALQTGMYLVGSVYNFCTVHHALRLPNFDEGPRWAGRTPAMATGLTDHVWGVKELLTFKVAPPLYVPPKRRGRPPKARLDSSELNIPRRCPCPFRNLLPTGQANIENLRPLAFTTA
jgi:transposase-like protein